MSIRNRSGVLGPRLEREVAKQVRLNPADADDEERAEPDGHQHDAGLVAGPIEVQHRMAHRERPRARQRRRRADERPAGAFSTRASTANPPQTAAPTFHDPACQPATPTSAAPTAAATPTRSQSRRAAATSCRRNNNDGLMCRTRSRGTRRKRTIRPIPTACAMAAGVSACERQRGSSTAQLFGRGGEGEASEGEPHQAPAESQGHHLHEVHGDDLPGAGADAFQHGDALQLLIDEYPRHAGHADAAEHDDHQPDETEIVLGALQILADLVLGRAERARVTNVF